VGQGIWKRESCKERGDALWSEGNVEFHAKRSGGISKERLESNQRGAAVSGEESCDVRKKYVGHLTGSIKVGKGQEKEKRG